MAMYALSDTTLTALGDAVRNQIGDSAWTEDIVGYEPTPIPVVSKTPNATSHTTYSGHYGYGGSLTDVVTIEGAVKLVVNLSYRGESDRYSDGAQFDYLQITPGTEHNVESEKFSTPANTTDIIRTIKTYENTDSLCFCWTMSAMNNDYLGYYADVVGYDADGNILNEMNPEGTPIYGTVPAIKMTVAEMTDTINGFLPGPTAENLVITGDCDYRFSNNGWNWFIEKYGNQITTNDISSLAFIFYGSNTLQSIPFELNLQIASYGSLNLNNVFSGCNALQEVPKINNVVRISNMDNLFYNCHKLREIPDDYFDGWNFDGLSNSSAYGNKIGTYLFSSCFSLRKVPIQFFQYDNKQITPYYCAYRNLFTNCYVLDQIVELPVPYTNTAYTTDLFYETFNNLSHLRELTFQTNEDGSPIVVQWKSQTIDLSKYVGYGPNTTYFTAFNSGLLAEDQITTKEQALERVNAETGEPDTSFNAVYRFTLPQSWTTDIAYSRYNKDSARRTLESLPDASAYLATAGGTNTIKFKGDSGSCLVKISSLEETDIAAAVAKGWTVTFV